MKRKLTAILLASMLAGVLLAGCGGGNNAGTQSSPAADNAGSAVSEAGSGTVTETTDAGAASAPSEETVSATTTETASATAAETASAAATAAETAKTDEELASECAALIDAIYVQERTETTDDDIAAARAAWDALTDEQKAMVEGEFADPDYFGRDTGDASLDDPLNADEIGENEILVVSFGTSFNESRATDIGGIEKALQAANPDWSVRRAFTAQIIINHVQARDGEVIDNVEQALARAKENGVKNLVIQPTHLMHGAEYDELMAAVTAVAADFETVRVAEPLLGQVGEDAAAVNEDKETVAKAVVAEAVSEAGFESIDAAAEDGTAFVFMGHGTAHVAKVTYSQMQSQMDTLGYKNVFIGTVEGEPEETACDQIIAKVKDAGYKKVILRPLMVVAGDHANNDMAGDEEDSWKSMFVADGSFDSVDCQIAGLGRIADVEALYAAHTAAAMDAEPLKAEAAPAAETAAAAGTTAETAAEAGTAAETAAAAGTTAETAAEAGTAAETAAAADTAAAAKTDEELAKECADLIDAIYVQERTETTDDDIAAARAAWDALTDEQKAMVEGEFADPDYFGRDTGDASLDDPLNADGIGENEMLVVSFGTSFNESRATDIGGIEKALQAAYPDWSVRRAFTAQIIINHVQARDGEVIDNVDQALARAKENGVKNLVIQPTHLMHGAEYDELAAAVDAVKADFETVVIAEPLLGEVGESETIVNDDKEAVAKAVVEEAVETAGFESLDAAEKDGTAFVFMGHGTAHVAKVTYSQMQTQMDQLGYKNVFIGTVEGEPEETSCENVIAKVKAAGYKKVILRPLMVVAGDHANNDMAGDEEDSWKSMFTADGSFESVDCQIAGLGRIPEVQDLYVAHMLNAIDGLDPTASAAAETAEEASEDKAGETGSAPIEDGTYIADFKTDSSMFHVNEANDGKGTLTVKDGKMTIHISLVSKKITNLFPGTAEEAQKEGAALLQPTTDEVTYSDGEKEEVFGFDVPVPALDQEFDCAILGEKGKWYDHKVTVSNPVKAE